MNKSSYKLAFSFLLFGALFFGLSGTAMAQRAKAKNDNNERQTKMTVAMSQSTYEALQKANEMVQEGSVVEGLAELQRFRNSRAGQKLTPYEQAQVWNLTAYAYYLQENYSSTH